MNTTIQNTTKYKNSPLGLIPEDWEVKKLGKLGEIISGLTYSPDDINENGVLVLRSSNVQDRQLEFNDNVHVNVKDGKFNPIKENDILICVRNGSKSLIGKNTLITKKVEGVAFGAFMAVFRSAQNKYLFQLFDTDYFNSEIHKNLGATINSINGSDLKQFKFPIPPPDEQTAIVNCLSTWDKAIEKQNALIAQKELSKKALMQQLISGKKRLKGFQKQKETHKTDFGYRIPKDWQIVTALDLFIERTEKSNDQNEYPLFSLTIENGLTEKTDRYERSFLLKDKENNQYKIVHPNDILFNPMNLRFGAIAKSEINIKVLVSAYYNVITISNNYVNLNYFIELFKSPAFNNFYDRIAIGSLMEKKRVHLSNFLKLQVPLPSLEEQNAIANVLQCADEELQLLKKKLEQLKEQKKGLMQILLTGKKRLKI